MLEAAWGPLGEHMSPSGDQNNVAFPAKQVDKSPVEHPGSPAAWKKRAFSRVPTHAVAPGSERRRYPRATLSLPLRLKRVAGVLQSGGAPLLTSNISSSGVYFLCPQPIEPGTPIEIEVGLVERPRGRGNVRMITLAHVLRMDHTARAGWHGLAVTFDDITFERDDAAVADRYR